MNRFDSNHTFSKTFDKTYSDNMEGYRNVAISRNLINGKVKRFSVEKDTYILHRQPLHSRDIHNGTMSTDYKRRSWHTDAERTRGILGRSMSGANLMDRQDEIVARNRSALNKKK